MKKPTAGASIAAVALALSAAGCSGAAAAGAGDGSQKRPGYITGTATSECGKPISTFTVNAYGFDGQPNEYPYGSPPLGTTTGHNGRYALRTRDAMSHKPVNALVDSIEASTTVDYQGHTYVLPLYPTDGIANFSGRSDNGLIRNFVLRTSGLKPGQSESGRPSTNDPNDVAAGAFYGANIILALSLESSLTVDTTNGDTLTLSFKPITPALADGCPARAFSRSVTLGPWEGTANLFVHDIPLGFWTLSGTLRGPAGARSLTLSLDGGQPTSSVEFMPVPNSMFADGSAAVTIAAS